MQFEWDDRKNKTNINKHGYSFAYATRVFKDMNRVESEFYVENGEVRFNVIGKVDDLILVVCTYRSFGKVRIISARRANKYEEGLYYDCY